MSKEGKTYCIRFECFGHDPNLSKCLILETSYKKSKECPFCKGPDEVLAGMEDSVERLRKIGKEDLVYDYGLEQRIKSFAAKHDLPSDYRW